MPGRYHFKFKYIIVLYQYQCDVDMCLTIVNLPKFLNGGVEKVFSQQTSCHLSCVVNLTVKHEVKQRGIDTCVSDLHSSKQKRFCNNNCVDSYIQVSEEILILSLIDLSALKA